MPTYQYACSGCGHQFETVQSFSDDSLTTCPDCGQDQLRKVFGSVGVVFKGSGFYRNDSRNERKRSGSTAGSADGKTGASPASGDAKVSGEKKSDSGKSDSKPSGTATTTSAPAKS